MDILGAPGFPEHAGSLPDVVRLPAASLGDIVDCVALTIGDGRERGQIVRWSRIGQQFKKEGPIIGTESAVALRYNNRMGLKGHPVLSFHTHPSDDSSRHSEVDIALEMFYPLSYISLVASEFGISGLFSTQTSESFKGALFKDIRFKTLRRRLERSGMVYYHYSRYRESLNELGFGYYCANSRTLALDDLSQGVTLYKNIGNVVYEFD